MPTTNASLVLAVTRYLRQHPDATDQEIAIRLGLDLRQGDLDTVITPGRKNFEADRAEVIDHGGSGFHPGLGPR